MADRNNPRTAGRYLTDESYVLETRQDLPGDTAGADDRPSAVPADLMFARELAMQVMAELGQTPLDAIAQGAHDQALGPVRKMLAGYTRAS